MMEDFQDLFSYENYAQFDKVRKLKWCNNAIKYALDYMRIIFNQEIDYDGLIRKLSDTRVIISLLYGAAKAADGKMDIMNFKYKSQNIYEYTSAVLDGIENYLPKPENIDHGRNLDEDWPDTQKQLQNTYEKTDWASWYHFAITKGISPEQFGEMTYRALYALYRQHMKERGIDLYSQNEGSCL